VSLAPAAVRPRDRRKRGMNSGFDGRSFARVAGAVAGVAVFLAGAGCIRLIDTSSRTMYTGQYVSEQAMEQIEPGKTTADFALAVLGPPTNKSTLDDGSELWKYSYRKAKSSSGSVFLLLD